MVAAAALPVQTRPEMKVRGVASLGLLLLVGGALSCLGCAAGSWKAPPIDGEFLVAQPVPGEEKDPTSAFDDEDEEPELAAPATPATTTTATTPAKIDEAPVAAPEKATK